MSESSNVVNMQVQSRLIREAREARAKRKVERETGLLPMPHAERLAEYMAKVRAGEIEGIAIESAQFPGGIDDMEI